MSSKPLISLALLLCGIASAFGADSAPAVAYPPFTLEHTEVRDLPFKGPGRQYQIQIALPASYHEQKDRRYPVIFVTDGYWDFPMLVGTHNNFIYDKVSPECIIVGLGYAGKDLNYGTLRTWDLTPAPVADSPDNSGHAAEYLALLTQEIIPLVEREYRADPHHRILAGSSYGGLFTLYAMLTTPETFSAYIAVSPATAAANGWIFDYEAKFAKSARPIQARLFISGAENEWPQFLDAIKRFGQRLDGRQYSGLHCSFELIKGERHAGTKAEAYARGMRYVLSPLAPESGPMADY